MSLLLFSNDGEVAKSELQSSMENLPLSIKVSYGEYVPLTNICNSVHTDLCVFVFHNMKYALKSMCSLKKLTKVISREGQFFQCSKTSFREEIMTPNLVKLFHYRQMLFVFYE